VVGEPLSSPPKKFSKVFLGCSQEIWSTAVPATVPMLVMISEDPRHLSTFARILQPCRPRAPASQNNVWRATL